MKHDYDPSRITRFAAHVLGKPLYPYQQEIAEAILASILSGAGKIFTVMLARQMGKNQLSAVLEAYLLTCMPEGTIVKAAPTFTPQILNSRLRLLSLLDTPFTRDRIWTSSGYVLGLAPQSDSAVLRAHAGPRVMFYSAGQESNVVGATADLLLEIDEAQDVSPEKFDRDFRPMAAVKNATTILYGTAWSDDTLLAQQRASNLAWQQQTGERRHFEYDWRTLAALNPAYRSFVEQEIARLGADHLAIQTQYFLRPISGAGYFLNPLQRTLLQGSHRWEDVPVLGRSQEGWYVAGMDVAGEERPAHGVTNASQQMTTQATHMGHTRRDSTVITIGRVSLNELNLPQVEIVHQQWWTGMPYLEQYAATVALAEQWGLRTLVVDATGLGAGLASLLSNRLGDERVQLFTFTRPGKSRLAYQLLALINSGRLKLYTAGSAPAPLAEECWRQLRLARYRLPAPEVLDFYVDPTDGHDDFLMSLALLTEALNTLSAPAASVLVRPRRLYEEEGKF
ncbi:MAG TPA: hypothetical protein VFQ30_18235 [Ktedonobacteraceae bacterium]|nr:hypothetical protein [Ktedonobacteraceae bacterium]